RAVIALELTWADDSYHGFSADDGLWSAISSAREVLTGDTPGRADSARRRNNSPRPEDNSSFRLSRQPRCEILGPRQLTEVPRSEVAKLVKYLRAQSPTT